MSAPIPFARSVCACPADVAFCRRWPGYLHPADLDTLAPLDLAPSTGALVATATGALARVRTLVPRTDPATGACIFLDAADRCRIHAVAPFGCAYFDAHTDGHARSRWGLRAIVASPRYRATWDALARLRPVVSPPNGTGTLDVPIL